MEEGNFHSRDGWYFKRLENGSVWIRKTVTPTVDSAVEHELLIPANEWASIVAAVSASGDTAGTYAAASILHAGDCDCNCHTGGLCSKLACCTAPYQLHNGVKKETPLCNGPTMNQT
jgi:hypothetical protein